MTEPAPATDAEIEQFKQDSARATSDVWHVSLPFVRKLIARLAETRVLAADNLRWFEEAKARAEAAEAKLATARAALEEVTWRLRGPQENYDRNGPTWTGKDGHEYHDASYILDFADEIGQVVSAALDDTGGGDAPSDGGEAQHDPTNPFAPRERQKRSIRLMTDAERRSAGLDPNGGFDGPTGAD